MLFRSNGSLVLRGRNRSGANQDGKRKIFHRISVWGRLGNADCSIWMSFMIFRKQPAIEKKQKVLSPTSTLVTRRDTNDAFIRDYIRSDVIPREAESRARDPTSAATINAVDGTAPALCSAGTRSRRPAPQLTPTPNPPNMARLSIAPDSSGSPPRL